MDSNFFSATVFVLVVSWMATTIQFDVQAANVSADQYYPNLVDTIGLCELQERLTHLGYYHANVDGINGGGTEAAIRQYEETHNLPKMGFATSTILKFVRDSDEQAHATGVRVKKITGAVLPRNGTVFHEFSSIGRAPLKIATSVEEDHFYVKVQDALNTDSYKTIFIRGGKTIETNVPLGSYIIKYVAGKTWYGPQCLFGIESLFNKAESKFIFQRQGNQISGYRIELILQRDGNLRTSRIPRGQF